MHLKKNIYINLFVNRDSFCALILTEVSTDEESLLFGAFVECVAAT